MENKKVVINIYGYSCTGKSAAADFIKQKYLGIYTVDFDKIKRQLSGYHHSKDGMVMRKLSREFFEVVCKTNKPILLLVPPFENQGEYLAYENIANEYGYTIHSFEFTAPKSVLLARYGERLESLDKIGIKNSIKTEEEFLGTFDHPYFVPENSKLFDSSTMSAEVIAQEILKGL